MIYMSMTLVMLHVLQIVACIDIRHIYAIYQDETL